MKYCLETKLFFDPKICNSIPENAMDVTDREYQYLSGGRNFGKVIVLGKTGKLELADPAPVEMTREEVEAHRLSAYADKVSGSDRCFAEAQRMQVMGEAGWEGVRAEGVRRFEAIQARYPWPAEQA